MLSAIAIAASLLGISPCASAQDGLADQAARLINNIRVKLDACGEEGLLAEPTGRRISTTAITTRPMLTWNPRLAAVAAAHAQAMVDQQFFDHVDPQGRNAGIRATRAGYHWRNIGENLAAGQRTVADAIGGWLLSEGHCRNLIDPRFTEFGIAEVHASSPQDPYGSYYVLIVGRPSGAQQIAARQF